jgi:hypothetical protein
MFASPSVDCYIDWLDAFKMSPCSFFCGDVVTAAVIAAEAYWMGRCVGEVLAAVVQQWRLPQIEVVVLSW